MLLAAAVVGSMAASPRARAGEADPWFGQDKALHVSISAALAGGGYGATAVLADDRRWRLPVGATLALGAGFGKEIYDLTGRGDASWRDLAWDVGGTVTGLAVAWLIDRLINPPGGG